MDEPWPVTNTIGWEEKRAAMAVLDSGISHSFEVPPGMISWAGHEFVNSKMRGRGRSACSMRLRSIHGPQVFRRVSGRCGLSPVTN